MKLSVVILMCCVVGCVGEQEVAVPFELQAASEVPDTQCTWVFTDCNTWLGSQFDRNRLCTQACGAPSACHYYNAPEYYTCAVDNDHCLNGATAPIYAPDTCSHYNWTTCTTVYERRGRCEITLGEP